MDLTCIYLLKPVENIMTVATVVSKWATFVIPQWREFSMNIFLDSISGIQWGRQEQGKTPPSLEKGES